MISIILSHLSSALQPIRKAIYEFGTSLVREDDGFSEGREVSDDSANDDYHSRIIHLFRWLAVVWGEKDVLSTYCVNSAKTLQRQLEGLDGRSRE